MALRLFSADNDWIVRIRAQFQHQAEVRQRVKVGVPLPEVPTCEMLADVLDVAFWASLTTNEGRPTRVRLVMLPSTSLETVLAFKHPIPFSEDEVAKLAPAARSTGWLAVDALQQPGTIWGISQHPISERLGAITIDVSDPGVIRVGFGPSQPFVVFAGRSATSPHDAGDMTLTTRLRRVLGGTGAAATETETETGNHAAMRKCLALSALARMVLEDRHGGTLLVVPDTTGPWMDSVSPFAHAFREPDTSVRDAIAAVQDQELARIGGLGALYRSDVTSDVKEAILTAVSQLHWHPEVVLRPVARLAAVDGAVVMTADLDILGFGAMISVGAAPHVYRVTPWPERTDSIDIEEVGGARHQSAVRFVGKHRESIALVISHDGHLSLAHWSREADGVLFLKNAEWWI
jgi:hypothetical protein